MIKINYILLSAVLVVSILGDATAQIPPGPAMVLYGKTEGGVFTPLVPNPASSVVADMMPGQAVVAWGRNADGTYSPLLPNPGTALTCTGCTLDGTTVLDGPLTATGQTISGGTFSGGAWNGDVVAGQYGGTGVANTGKTITLGGSLATSGAFDLTLTLSGATGVTLPTSGTLATLAGAEALTNKTYNGNTWTAGTGTLTLGAGKTLTASNTLTLSGTDGSSVAFGGGGTIAYTANKLSVFAATTSAELFGVVSDETGSSGVLVGSSSPALTGTPSSTNASAGAVTTALLLVNGADNGAATGVAIKFQPSSISSRTATIRAEQTAAGSSKLVFAVPAGTDATDQWIISPSGGFYANGLTDPGQGIINATAYRVNNTTGADCTLSGVTTVNLTVVKGLVTACSGS